MFEKAILADGLCGIKGQIPSRIQNINRSLTHYHFYFLKMSLLLPVLYVLWDFSGVLFPHQPFDLR